SSRELVAIGLSSIELRRIVQKLLLTSAARLVTDFPRALTNPIRAWLRTASTVTRPSGLAMVDAAYQASSPVSETIGLGTAASPKDCVGGPFSEEMRTSCWSGKSSGIPGVKYGRSLPGSSMLSKT